MIAAASLQRNAATDSRNPWAWLCGYRDRNPRPAMPATTVPRFSESWASQKRSIDIKKSTA
jgi:hypothetical protein